MERNRDEVHEAFVVQTRALESSCRAFDQGDTWEAVRLATAVCILVHDDGQRSLLTELGLKRDLVFLASGRQPIPGNLVPDACLTNMQISTASGVSYVPKLGGNPEYHHDLPFTAWWVEPIYRSGGGLHLLSRRDICLTIRNQDGGAHFDKHLKSEGYAAIVRGDGWLATHDGVQQPLRGVQLASTRQIAWELLGTFRRASILPQQLG